MMAADANREVGEIIDAMDGKVGPLAERRDWIAVSEWESFSARFVLVQAGSLRLALKLGTNWDSDRVVFVAKEIGRVRELLSSLPGGGVVMPEVFGVLADPPALAISYVEGDLLFDSLSTLDSAELTDYLTRCGRAIGAYHTAQPASAVGSPEPFSSNGLRKVARLGGVTKRRVEAIVSSLHNARRYQFSPNDILVDHDENIVLLDPPHFSKYDYVHRDLAAAFVELHRGLVGGYQPGDTTAQARVELAQEAFEAGYAETGPITLDDAVDRLAIGLFSISRVLGVASGRFRSGQVHSGLKALRWALWIRGRLPRERDLE